MHRIFVAALNSLGQTPRTTIKKATPRNPKREKPGFFGKARFLLSQELLIGYLVKPNSVAAAKC